MKKVIEKIVSLKDLVGIREDNKDKKIGICSGCFDVFHSGHAVFFEQCKELVDVLIVVVGSDSAIKMQKGAGRPVNEQNNRVYLTASICNVDYAMIGCEGKEMRHGKIDYYEIVKNLKPDILILNNDDSAIKEKQELCKEFGIGIKLVKRIVPEFLKSVSSTKIIEHIKEENIK
jgi:D-beta-D-heptose 7-phosphate kinase/D-beta-D-heptose 1-phosphate adenosyltransferase